MNEAIFKEKVVGIMLRDGTEYKILPLTLNQMLGIWPLIADLTKLGDNPNAMDETIIKKMIKLVAGLLKASGYNDITEKKAGDLVDLADIKKLIAIVMGQNPELLEKLSK